MQETSFEGRFTKRSRSLVHALIISVAFNLGLLATFISVSLREKKIETLLQTKAVSKPIGYLTVMPSTNNEILKEYKQASFKELINELKNQELLQQGYRKRDLALACMVSFHHFDLEKALPGIEIQKRSFKYGTDENFIELMPGFNSEHFESIYYFAHFEMWPLTSEGLFKQMQHRRPDIPETLQAAFFLSKEFYILERAFSRFPFVFTKETLLHLFLDGNWSLVKYAMAEIERHPYGEIEMIGAFLTKFENSKLAAYLLIALDPDFAYMQFSDERLIHLMDFLDQQTEEAQTFLSLIMTSARSDAIRLIAEEKVRLWESSITSLPMEYVVQKGDSLWSLSGQFNILIKEIKEINNLESDILTPGQVLKIPCIQIGPQ